MTEIQGLTGAVSGAAARAASTASAGSLTLPAAPLLATYPITGTTPITSITAGPAGQVAILEFASAGCRVVKGSNIQLVDDFWSTAKGSLALQCDGTNWTEIARTTPLWLPSNSLINGDFGIWQRATSFSAVANGAYTADRWRMESLGAASLTIARDTSVPSVAANAINSSYSLKMTIPVTPDTSIAAGDLYGIIQAVEGYNYRALTNGFALSFWVKAHRTGTYCVAFANKGDRSYIAEYTINVADTWEYKTVVVSTPPTAGTWGYTNDHGLLVMFTLAVGSTYQTTAGSWNTGEFYGTSNQVNGVGATTDTFALALVNLAPGTQAYPFNPRPYAQEFALCQRYCQQLCNGSVNERIGVGHVVSTTQFTVYRPLPVQMRVAPTATYSAANTFAGVTNAGGVAALTAIATNIANPNGLTIVGTGAANYTLGQATQLLDNGSGAASILLDAEL